ncbi:aminotransferase class III-fold pyridoxal phosphate-dependent enzyme [Kitasatospora griseola]|uniref:aminotransferase class III-fold pyridoxal phosphate-dependent enzyme n=1 Tax=Kitasatospora griseola TaxID=2064 RepID=UPI0038558AAD
MLAAAADKTLEIVSRPEFLAHVRTVGAHLMERLRDLATRYPRIGDVRGLGLMIGLELVDRDGRPDTPLTLHLAHRGMDHGLILRTSRYGRGNVLKIRPPLIITTEEADLLCDRLETLFAAEAT